MEASIITIGDELLIGQVLDTNSQYLSKNLQTKGIHVNRLISCGDLYEEIWESIDYAFQYSDIVIVTGGLGPTKDDITKKVLCDYFHDNLIFDEQIFKKNLEKYYKISVKITESNKNQALVPEHAKIFSNEIGSAQGMMFEKDGKFLISLPGVPYEMYHIFENGLSKYLENHLTNCTIFHKTYILTGISESLLAEIIKDWEESLPNYIKFAYLPSYFYLKIRLSCYSADYEKNDIIKDKISELEPLISKYVISDRDEDIEELLGRLLREKKATISTAESCTGGRIASAISKIAGASDYFKGSVVAYSNEIKENVLNVGKNDIEEYGAVSKEVVSEMARNVRKIMKTDYAIATSGIAGPTGGSPQKPVGTIWIAIADENDVYTINNTFSPYRELNILKTTNLAIASLIKILLNKF